MGWMSARPILLAALVAVAMTAAIAPQAASAAQFKWKKQTVRYYSASRDAKVLKSLTVAVDFWNKLGLRVKLVRTRSRGSADILVRLRPQSFFPGDALGLGQLPGGNPSTLDISKNLYGTSVQQVTLAVLVHELGHNLGIKHVRGCAVMNAIVSQSCGTLTNASDEYQCAPTAVDYRALRKLYRRKSAPKYFSCSDMLIKHSWLEGSGNIAAPLQWSTDRVNWSSVDGAVPGGTTVWLRYAVTNPQVIFGRYFDLGLTNEYLGGPESACVSRTEEFKEPTSSTSCETVEVIPGFDSAQATWQRSGEWIWFEGRFKPFYTSRFSGWARFGLGRAVDSKASAGELTLTVAG